MKELFIWMCAIFICRGAYNRLLNGKKIMDLIIDSIMNTS